MNFNLTPQGIEDVFGESARMRPAEPKDEDPYKSEEYSKFVESMVPNCRCEPYSCRPCDGVLAGGLCDCAGHREWVCGGYFEDEEDL